MSVMFYEKGTGCYYDADALKQDLNLQTIMRGMARKDYEDEECIWEELLTPLTSVEEAVKRQKVVADACEQEKIVMELREIICPATVTFVHQMEAIQDSRGKNFLSETMVGTYLDALRTLVGMLVAIHHLIEKNETLFEESGFRFFRDSFYEEVSPEKILEQQELVEHLDAFKRKGEITLSGVVSEGLFVKDVHLISVAEKAKKGGRRLFASKEQLLLDDTMYESAVEFTNRFLLDLLEDSLPYLKCWEENLHRLRSQIAFLAGCVKLHAFQKTIGIAFCFPDEQEERADGLYDLSLALQTQTVPVSNSLARQKYHGIIVTGANQGGKSTFLRSMGIAQVMCQAGMFVPAAFFPLHVYDNIYTHFTRREDASMNMGKFEEELKRMQGIIRHARENTVILLNESFATTTEVTAYQIAMDLIHACLEEGISIWMVTHITSFAKQMYEEGREDVLFLSAGREANHEERYSMVEKAPENTSYGLDLYDEIIFGDKKSEKV
ncbi:MAG: hypothetical protein J5972_02510 [Eubacterium sp.]|nr:hypothetical protein [Eubacterium sp.]